ncbi:hypothetical protein LLH03_03980 [bacterium]|nr:hypothetical protein [bacterium]
MGEMQELITIEGFGRTLGILCVLWSVVSLVLAAIAAARGQRRGLCKGLIWALLGPLTWGLWKYYGWMVRVVPETGYVGLHRTSVFAINLLVFLVVGAGVGYVLGRLYHRSPAADEDS